MKVWDELIVFPMCDCVCASSCVWNQFCDAIPKLGRCLASVSGCELLATTPIWLEREHNPHPKALPQSDGMGRISKQKPGA